MRQTSVVMLSTLLIGVFTPVVSQADQQPIISRLQLRDRVVTISSQANGELSYSIKSPNGEVLDASLSEEQLLAKYPEIHQQIRPAIANSSENADGILMMRRDIPRR